MIKAVGHTSTREKGHNTTPTLSWSPRIHTTRRPKRVNEISKSDSPNRAIITTTSHGTTAKRIVRINGTIHQRHHFVFIHSPLVMAVYTTVVALAD
jgi:hypothetical protein